MPDREKVIREKVIKELEHYIILCADIRNLLKFDKDIIVRCKDCKKHDTYDCNITYLTTQKTPNDWYCADGERKEGR